MQADPLPRLIARWRADARLFVREALGVEQVEQFQDDALWALSQGKRVAIRSGHGVGKSALMAWALLWYSVTHYPHKIPCTAPSAHQLFDILWAEIGTWLRRLRELWPVFGDELELKSDRLEWKSAPQECFAAARTARKESPEALQGFHSQNLLFLIDEASGVEDNIFEVSEGALSTAGAIVLMAGNPTRTSGYFYDAFHRSRERWHTMRVSCEESSRVSKEYIDGMRKRYGADSNVYRVRVLGEFPNSDDNAVIPLDLCEAAVVRQVEPHGGMVWGVDVARFGSDRTALCKRRGNTVPEPIKTWRQKDTMQVAGLIYLEWQNTPPDARPSNIAVDVIGIGAGVVDRLRELSLPVTGINVAEAASIDERYMRLRDELWFRARDWLAAKDCKLPEDEALIAELSTPTYAITSSGRLKVEGKDEMKKRGVDSPDIADAFCLTFAVVPIQRLEPHQLEPECYVD